MLLRSIMWLFLLAQERNFAIDRNWKLWTTETTSWGDTNDSPDASQNSRLIVGRQKVPHCDFTWLMSPLESVATKIQLRGCKWGFRSKAKRPPGRSISYYLLISWRIVCVWWLAMWLGVGTIVWEKPQPITTIWEPVATINSWSTIIAVSTAGLEVWTTVVLVDDDDGGEVREVDLFILESDKSLLALVLLKTLRQVCCFSY